MGLFLAATNFHVEAATLHPGSNFAADIRTFKKFSPHLLCATRR
jgi:hypothetical protein